MANQKTRPSLRAELESQGGDTLCEQIARLYRRKILEGVYPDGARLPTCREAGSELGVASQTVKRAFDILAEEGLVFSRRSVGTVVTLSGDRKQNFTRRPRSPRQTALPLCQIIRMSAMSEKEVDLFYDYQHGLAEGFDTWRHRFEIAYLREEQSDLDLVKMLVEEKQVRGIVSVALSAEAEEYLINSGFPVVFLNRDYSARGAAAVAADRVGGYREAWEYVDALGHRKAAFFGVAGRHFESRFRECVSGHALAQASCRLGSQVNVADEADSIAIWKSLLDAYGPWKQGPRPRRWPTLFFAQTDVIATRLLRALRENGVRVPDDISVIGYNDAQIARYWDPMLTTLAIPRYPMALAASRLLLDLLAGRPSAKGAQQIFPVRLIQRETCARV